MEHFYSWIGNIPMTEVYSTLGLGLITLSFLPQVIKILRTKDTSAISLPMYSMYVGGCLCMLLLGIELRNYGVIAWEIFGLILSSTILTLKVRDVILHEGKSSNSGKSPQIMG